MGRYLEIAKRAMEEHEADRERCEERAAIYEFEAYLPRGEAERLAEVTWKREAESKGGGDGVPF